MRATRGPRSMIVALAVVLLLTAGCTDLRDVPGSGRDPGPPRATGGPGKKTSPGRPAAGGAAFVPGTDRRIPARARPLARDLARTTFALRDAIDAWLELEDPPRDRPPRPVTLLALYQQRVYRLLAMRPALAARVTPRLPRRLRPEARANTVATARFLSLARPIRGPSGFSTGPPPPPGRLLHWYRKAERRFDVDWEVLAAVHYAETKFGRVRSASTAGAQGPMQFIPSTWAAYGMGGDVHDTHDAILGAANYLRASGAPRDYRRALYAYNRSWAYVDAILLHARQMMRDRRDFYAYYGWQVFVLTAGGDRRLTGPGAPRR